MCLPPKIEATHFAAATLAWITHSTHLAFSPVESEPDVPDDGRDVGHPQSDRLLLSALLSGRGSLHSDHTCHAPRLPLPHWVYTLLEERSTSLASKRKQFDFCSFHAYFVESHVKVAYIYVRRNSAFRRLGGRALVASYVTLCNHIVGK